MKEDIVIGGRTRGGSKIILHEEVAGELPVGLMSEEVTGYHRIRDEIYGKYFGEATEVLHELLPLIPHVDVYQYPPGYRGRDYWTIVTSGMSDLAMTLPSGVPSSYARSELIFYCNTVDKQYPLLLRNLAHFVHDAKTWLGEGHTLPMGDEGARVFDHTPSLSTLLFLPTMVSYDRQLCEELEVDGDPVNLLWVVPISSAECDLKLAEGTDALLKRFNESRHPMVFSGDRASYV